MNKQNNSGARSPKTKRLHHAVLDLLIAGVFLFVVLGCTCNKFEMMKSGNSKTVDNRPLSNTSTKEVVNNNDTETLVTLTNLIAQDTTYSHTGNKQGLERIYADDFIGYEADGWSYNKRDFIAIAEKDESFKSVTVDKAQLLANDGSTAKVSCTKIREYTNLTEANNQIYTFVRQNGSWRIKSHQNSKPIVTKK